MKTTVLGLSCLAFLALAACSKETTRLEGEVVKISGALPQLLRSAGALTGNESVRLGEASLILTVKESDGHIRTLDVRDNGGVTKAAILSRVCVGTKVTYTVVVTKQSNEELALDPHYYTGRQAADDLLVPEACLK